MRIPESLRDDIERLELVDDLDAVDGEEGRPTYDVMEPQQDPAVPACYEDCDPDQPTGYSDLPQTRLFRLSRKDYPDQHKALDHFEFLQRKHNWQVHDYFWSARYWCWRIS